LHFEKALQGLTNPRTSDDFELVLGGHSLGAMLALKALEINELSQINKRAVLVGLGMAPKKVVHLFDTPFYKATLIIRNELVSKELHSDNVFPWKEKEDLKITNHKIHFITGVDDLVVGEDGTERFMDHLLQLGNFVTMEKPTKLPHHEPNLAAPHIKKYFKDQKLL
jgi:predicted esterase